MQKLKKYKNYNLIVNKVINKSSSQKIKILRFLSLVDKLYFNRAETFSREFLKYLKDPNIELDYAIKAYLKLYKLIN